MFDLLGLFRTVNLFLASLYLDQHLHGVFGRLVFEEKLFSLGHQGTLYAVHELDRVDRPKSPVIPTVYN